MAQAKRHRRQWRFYETKAGNKPVKDFLDGLPSTEAAEIAAAMKHVANAGLPAARHLRGDIWEVRVSGDNRTYRVLFSAEGRFSQVLLALEGFTKQTQKTPPRLIEVAEKRLSDWRRRGKSRTRPGK